MDSAYPDDAEAASDARAAIGGQVRARLSRNPMVSRVANERVEMYLRHGFLTAAECDALIAVTDADARPSVLFSGTGNATYRTSSSCNLDPHDALVVAITERMSGLLGLPADHGETLQAQRYETGQEYKLHCDYFPAYAHYWPAMRESGGQRCWTVMAYLNDVAEGGETHFPRAGIMIPPRRGTLLVWNNMRGDGSPNGETVHAARPVTAGAKYVVTKWYRERPWTPRAGTP
jgi:prolyl 4-hydroxylase